MIEWSGFHWPRWVWKQNPYVRRLQTLQTSLPNLSTSWSKPSWRAWKPFFQTRMGKSWYLDLDFPTLTSEQSAERSRNRDYFTKIVLTTEINISPSMISWTFATLLCGWKHSLQTRCSESIYLSQRQVCPSTRTLTRKNCITCEIGRVGYKSHTFYMTRRNCIKGIFFLKYWYMFWYTGTTVFSMKYLVENLA